MLGLCKAAEKWDESKSQFSTFAWGCIKNEILMEFRKRAKHQGILSLDYEVDTKDGKARFAEIIPGDKDVDYADIGVDVDKLKPREKVGDYGETLIDLDPLKKFPNTSNDTFNIISDLNGKGYENFIIVQFHGGQSPLCDCNTQYDENNEPLQRHYPSPLAQKFIDLFREKFPKTAIINYSLPNEPHYNGAERYDIPYLSYVQLAKNNKCLGFVSIDSSLQHLISGIKNGVVIWGHSLPNAFGYKCNTNIIQKCRRDDILYMNLLGPSGAKIDYIQPNDLLDVVSKNIINNKELN